MWTRPDCRKASSWSDTSEPIPALSEPFDILEQLADAAEERSLPYILIGGHAVSAWGYLRTTLDVDLLIPAGALPDWRELLEGLDYRLFHETRAFVQFEPVGGTGFPVDLMLVDQTTYRKLEAASELLPYASRSVRVAGVLHLIALKLHALQQPTRMENTKDFQDILALIQANRLDPASEEFRSILKRYASESTRRRLEDEFRS